MDGVNALKTAVKMNRPEPKRTVTDESYFYTNDRPPCSKTSQFSSKIVHYRP